jgi:hypothetical protein
MTTTSSAKLHISDDALVTFTQPNSLGVSAFHDSGFMPITEATIANGVTTHFYLQYDSTGSLQFGAQGPVSADYSSLHYREFAYTGNATFGHAADGTPTITGVHDAIQVMSGDLIPGHGHLAFNPNGSISGEVNVTAKIGGAGPVVGQYDIAVSHAASDIGFTRTGGMTLTGGTSTASYFSHV